MPTTTKMGIVYPASTDLVKDGATAMGTISTTVDSKTGLVLLTAASFTSVSSVSLPANTFSSSYNDYLLLITFTGASTNLDFSMRMRINGVDNSGGNYDRGGALNGPAVTLQGLGAGSQTKWDLGAVNASLPTYSQWAITIKSPKTSQQYKQSLAQGSYVNNSGQGIMWWSNNLVSSTDQFDSASLIASTGSFSGNYSVYGYNK